MSTHENKGKRRLKLLRVREMGAPGATPQHPSSRVEQLRQNARFRGSKESLRASLQAVVGAQVRRAIPSDAAPEASRLVALNALQLASDAARAVGVACPFVAHHVTRFGVSAALAAFYTQAAAELGFDSPRGLTLIEAAHRCEGRAERAMVAAEAAVRAFGAKRRQPTTVVALIEARAQEYLAEAEAEAEAEGTEP